MEVTNWLKPSDSVSRMGDSASVQAATRHGTMLPSPPQNEISTSELDPFRSSILGPWSPL